MLVVKENDVYKREREKQFTNKETITFKIPEEKVYEKAEYDWYMTVALEKSDAVTHDRHLLTYELLVSYRNAIREGFNHELDPALKKPHAFPKNQNTIKGIENYIEKIKKEEEKRIGQFTN